MLSNNENVDEKYLSVHVANERWSRSKANTTLNTIRGADNARSNMEHEIEDNFEFECSGTDTCARSNLCTLAESPRFINLRGDDDDDYI